MVEFFQIRLAPTLILGVFASLFISFALGAKLDERRFRSRFTYNLSVYSPFIVLALIFITVLFTL